MAQFLVAVEVRQWGDLVGSLASEGVKRPGFSGGGFI